MVEMMQFYMFMVIADILCKDFIKHFEFFFFQTPHTLLFNLFQPPTEHPKNFFSSSLGKFITFSLLDP